tara:strand:- start:2317 stop:2673 length:357 start_codon:yes stop_codon:yes gene_type:complete
MKNPITYISDKIKLVRTKSKIKSEIMLANRHYKTGRNGLLGWYTDLEANEIFHVYDFTRPSAAGLTGIAHTNIRTCRGKIDIVWERHLIQCKHDPDNILKLNKYRKMNEEECLILDIK